MDNRVWGRIKSERTGPIGTGQDGELKAGPGPTLAGQVNRQGVGRDQGESGTGTDIENRTGSMWGRIMKAGPGPMENGSVNSVGRDQVKAGPGPT
ncbi:hypothetical protein EVAR_25212_1 [Eumeta japonica]|uniref:Uncharacterized protein n=1 Tax=Eumeta variegata TaxID=151549 RepID=A0A4C1WK74_EUMVA|nr:hypothetical protein EVAR_25212_1 [Eumeta japonica]